MKIVIGLLLFAGFIWVFGGLLDDIAWRRETRKKARRFRIKLNFPEFAALVRGGQVTFKNKAGEVVGEMILADIGFDFMELAVNASRQEANHYKGVTVSYETGEVISE